MDTPRSVALLLGLAAFNVSAQQQLQPSLDASAAISSQQLRPGLHVLIGGGGNIAVWHGADGIIVVDDNLAPLAPRVVEAIDRIASGPVRFVINTHWHPDHTGGNELLGKSGGIIVAQDNVRTRMSEEQFIELANMRIPASAPVALPIVTFDQAVTLYLNGDRVEVFHVSAAHTDGDAVLKWQTANVIHTGDVYLSRSYPFIDRGSGGTLAGLVAAAEEIIARSDDATVLIPGHGPVSSRSELVQYRDMVVTVARRIRAAVEAGQSLEEVLASRPSAEFDARYGQGFMTPDRFVGILYRELAAPAPGLRQSDRN